MSDSAEQELSKQALQKPVRGVLLDGVVSDFQDLATADEPADRQNINISAYRVLYILLLLVQHQTLPQAVLNKYLFENPLIQRTYNAETIQKYINTLRKVGCKIPRSSSRYDYHYVLKENPFPMILDEDELAVAIKVQSILAETTDVRLQLGYLAFIQQVAWMLESPQKELLQGLASGVKPALDLQARRSLLKQYQDYCSDSLVLEIEYQADLVMRERLFIEPIRVIHKDKNNLFLLGMDRNQRGSVKLNLNKIISVRQLPSKVNTTATKTTVMFQLYGRLAKTYRLYPGEEIILQLEDTIQVRAKTDDVDSLLTRLLKYNNLCQVIAPASARQTMQQKIRLLLNTLQPTSALVQKK